MCTSFKVINYRWASTATAYEVGFLHAGGGIPCRPHPRWPRSLFLYTDNFTSKNNIWQIWAPTTLGPCALHTLLLRHWFKNISSPYVLLYCTYRNKSIHLVLIFSDYVAADINNKLLINGWIFIAVFKPTGWIQITMMIKTSVGCRRPPSWRCLESTQRSSCCSYSVRSASARRLRASTSDRGR